MIGKPYLAGIILLFTACSTVKVSEPPGPHRPEPVKQAATAPLPSNVIVLHHKYFEVHYDTRFRLPRYVKYTVAAAQLREHEAKRRDRFFADPELQARHLPAVQKDDYSGSGYDRGHMAPAADFAFSQEANDDTFVMSNMAPQSKNLNEDAWARLEKQVRRWGCGEEKITVITGPVLAEDLPRLPSGVPVPKQFYKIVIDETPPRKVLAFIFNQTDRGDVWRERIVPLKSVEEKAHEDFTPETTGEPVRQPAQAEEWKEGAC